MYSFIVFRKIKLLSLNVFILYKVNTHTQKMKNYIKKKKKDTLDWFTISIL